jgi:hypothetical protein
MNNYLPKLKCVFFSVLFSSFHYLFKIFLHIIRLKSYILVFVRVLQRNRANRVHTNKWEIYCGNWPSSLLRLKNLTKCQESQWSIQFKSKDLRTSGTSIDLPVWGCRLKNQKRFLVWENKMNVPEERANLPSSTFCSI